MLSPLSKGFFHLLAGSSGLKSLASRYGMRQADSFARRFIAGESIEEAIEAARALEAQHLLITLDFLGESVTSSTAANDATTAYLDTMRKIAAAGIGRNVSLKLTQLGLDIDRATCVDNLRRILDEATAREFFVRIDMENSPYTERTLEIFETLWEIGYRNAGVVIQSYLKRSEADVVRVNKLGARIRLVKGAYKEPATAAFQQKAEVDAQFVHLMKLLLVKGTYPAIATHDEAMIRATTEFAAANGIAKDKYEFQMLYGIRRDLQASLSAAGHPFRVYVPFGREWFPYFMRRLGERPANIGFVLRGIRAERR
ncbi:MAG: proline dehydrogenase [Acidobacteria bacterium]|nr:MAG: proline dehydrogenase [Acidobacteriota bacterium]